MNEKILTQLNDWFEQENHNKIIETINNIPKEDLDYNLINHLGRAYNNIDDYDKALETLNTVSKKGITDALWNFRVGYAYYYKDENEKALSFFKKSSELGDKVAPDFIKNIMNIRHPPEKTYSSKPTLESLKQQIELQTKMLNQSNSEFEQNMTKLKSDFPFDYWHSTLYKEYKMEQYTLENCKKAETLMNSLITELIELGLSTDEELKIEKFKKATIGYNTLNDECDAALIETGERESLCEIIDKIGIVCGIIPEKYGDGDGIASEWRDW